MKKWHLVVLVYAVVMAIVTACGGASKPASEPAAGGAAPQPAAPAASEAKFPSEPINLIVSYSPGGGTDTSARILQPFLEKELGVPVNVLNKPGGGGWVGWAELAAAKADGYTIGYINAPNILTGYLNPSANRKENLDSFQFLANQVSNPEIIAIRTDETRFTNIQELMEYAKTNEVTTTGTGVAGDDHVAALRLNKNFGTKFTAVQFPGTAESRTAVLGGHVDVLFASVDEVYSLHQNKELKVIAVMEKERSKFLPDVPTLEEGGFPNVYSSSTRGIAAPVGVDPAKIEVLSKALENAIQNQEQVAKMEEMAIAIKYLNGPDYTAALKQEEAGVKEVFDLLGW